MQLADGRKLSELRDEPAVFVWGVDSRCGSGLLQRLITSSREVVVYGEDRLLTEWLPSVYWFHDKEREAIKASTDELTSGKQSWFPNARPDSTDYQDTVLVNFFNLVSTYEKASRESGFSRWGAKLPKFLISNVEILAHLLPQSRHICLYRDISDVVKSQKSRGLVNNIHEVQKLCSNWATRLAQLLQHAPDLDYLRPVKFEKLLADKKEGTGRICDHLDLSDVDMEVFEHKSNTWSDEEESQYVDPDTLSDREKQLIEQIPDRIMQAGGYALDSSPHRE